MRMRDPSRASWWTDTVETRADFTDDLQQLARSSQFVASLLQEQIRPLSFRYISAVVRERERFTAADWVLVETGSARILARIRGMAECLVQQGEAVHSVVRFWCDSVLKPNLGADGELWAYPPKTTSHILVRLESVYITVKTCNKHATHLVFT